MQNPHNTSQRHPSYKAQIPRKRRKERLTFHEPNSQVQVIPINPKVKKFSKPQKKVSIIYRPSRDGTEYKGDSVILPLTKGNQPLKQTGKLYLANFKLIDLNKFTFFKHGLGIIRGSSGTLLQGSWDSGKLEGYIKVENPNTESKRVNFECKVVNGLINDENFKQVKKQKNNFLIEFPTGEIYEGECLEVLPHGKGSLLFPNGDHYKGNFYLGLFHGKGVFQEKNFGYVYQGNFKNGVAEGEGTITEKDGSFYTGNFIKGKQDGFGKWTSSKGSFYEGQWSEGKQHGKGKYVVPESYTYEGEFVKGEAIGKGTLTEKDGSVYCGGFENGKKNGFGTLKRFDGYVFKGNFVDGMLSGDGVYIDVKGTVYQGGFKNGLKHGKGVLRYKNGDVFKGKFIDGLKGGEGAYLWASGHKKEGHWKKNIFCNEVEVSQFEVSRKDGVGSESTRRSNQSDFGLEKKEDSQELTEDQKIVSGNFIDQ